MDAIRCRSASILKIPTPVKLFITRIFFFMERGRTNYLRLLGTNQHALLQEARNDAPGFTFVVRSMTIDFLKPAVLDDVLDVITLPQEVRGASIALLQECRRADDLLVTARVRVYLGRKSAAYNPLGFCCDIVKSVFSLPLYLAISVFQCFAKVPGVSRSGATIVSAMLFGADKRSAADFSFYLAIPTMSVQL